MPTSVLAFTVQVTFWPKRNGFAQVQLSSICGTVESIEYSKQGEVKHSVCLGSEGSYQYNGVVLCIHRMWLPLLSTARCVVPVHADPHTLPSICAASVRS